MLCFDTCFQCTYSIKFRSSVSISSIFLIYLWWKHSKSFPPASLKYVAYYHELQSPYCAVQKQNLFLLSTCITIPLKNLSPYFPTLCSAQLLVITITLFNFYEINFVRFHTWVRPCGVCLSVSGLFNLINYFQVLPMLFKIRIFQSFYDLVVFNIYIFYSSIDWVLRFVPNV